MPETGLTVDGDQERLHQLLANLVDNATRHAGPGGQVVLRARSAAEQVVIDVLDTGPGIPLEERETVFERFHTLRPPGSHQHSGDGGTGLGLAIARWVTQLHGGTIEVADLPPRGGCDIRVTLPRRTSELVTPSGA